MNAQSTSYDCRGLEQLPELAGRLLDYGNDTRVWLFRGEMGVGKTTLIQVLCRQLGVGVPVQSPTFSIVNEYLTTAGEPVYHFDCYRLKNEEEAYDIGAEEYLDSGHRCFVEWPEKIESLWPERYLLVSMDTRADGTRSVRAEVVGRTVPDRITDRVL